MNYFTGVRAKWEPLYTALHTLAAERLGAFEERVNSGAITWRHISTFAEVSAKRDGITITFAAASVHDEWEPDKVLQTSKNRVVHSFLVTDDARFAWFVDAIADAYALTQPLHPRAVAEQDPDYSTVDEYIARFPPDVQAILAQTRVTLRAALPEAAEKISWGMPTYHQKENLIHYAAAKAHLGIYPGASGVKHFLPRLGEYKTSAGAIQFPFSRPIPYELIAEIAQFRLREATE